MASLLGLLHSGAASLGAQQAGVSVTGNNIANAQTPGFARRNLRIDEGRGGLHGGGAVATGMTRSEDFILSQKIAYQHGEFLNRSQLATGLQEVEQVLQAGQSNLSQKVAELARALSELSPSPQDTTRRSDVIEKGRGVALEFNRVAQALGRICAMATERARGLVGQIDHLARQLAALNQRVAAGAGGAAAPDMALQARNLDRRDELARTLAGLAGGKILRNGDGTLDVLVGGLALVHGAIPATLELREQGSSLTLLVGGVPPQLALGGELGAALTVRDVAQATLGQFDRLAFDFSAALNAQHAFGVGLDGVGARSFFERLGAVAGAALSLRLDGALTVQTLAAGFTDQPGDNRNAVALANLIDQPVLEGGRASFRNVYARIAAQLGAGVQQAEGEAATAEEHLDALDKAWQAVAGVQTDEETARLLAYQRGFEASARFIRTIDEMLERLVTL